ncbi:MAG: sodium:proton antiporter [Deltaproteobacteria bacterium]|nr:sodium:proton antiporter [Kofleriaceae bacterium]
MSDFEVASILISLTAAFAYFNARVLRLPSAIGLMVTALAGSAVVLALDGVGVTEVAPRVEALLDQVNLPDALLHGMLGVLLFAGALHVDLSDLKEFSVPIGVLALFGTAVSTAAVGGASYVLLDAVGLPTPFVYCLLFGALISPTDPIAVLGILKAARAPRSLEVTITGESMFNDGVGVVIFLGISAVIAGGDVSTQSMARLFVQEAIGGALFGLVLGYIGFRLLRSIDQYSVEILITLAMVLGGYVAAEQLHVSAPIAAVTAGLLVGNHGRAFAMSETTRDHLDTFWELIDEILNAVLFLIIGLEVVHLRLTTDLIVAGLAAIPLVLVARLLSVAAPIAVMPKFRKRAPGAIKLLTWGGLRGGISVALALSIAPGPERNVILVITYFVVVFSIVVQGTTLGRVARPYARS